jgi:hypothetical protein
MKATARRDDAACWLLTEYPEGDCKGPGSLDFMRWRPEKPLTNGLENHSTVRIADELSHTADRQGQIATDSH